MNDIFKSALVLTITAAISGFSIGVVNNIFSPSKNQNNNTPALSHTQPDVNLNQLSIIEKPDSLSKVDAHE